MSEDTSNDVFSSCINCSACSCAPIARPTARTLIGSSLRLQLSGVSITEIPADLMVSIADLGPQDLSDDLRVWKPDITAGLVDARDLYSKWGLKDYKAFDLFDSRAEIVDLNID